MPFLILVASLLCIPANPYLLKNASDISKSFHKSCLNLLPQASQNISAHAALLCGQNVTEQKLKNSLAKSSLIHLFVVSGSHIILLEELLIYLQAPLFFRFLLFVFYALACSWQAPLVRAILSLCSRKFFQERACFWPNDLLVLWTGLLTLCFFPDWISSRGLLMSWLAALALSLTPRPKKENLAQRILLASIFIYIFMFPLLWGLGNLHPLAIPLNVFLGPYVSFFLLPLSFLNCFFPFLTSFFDHSFNFFLWISAQATEPITLEQKESLPLPLLWGLLFILHFVIHFSRVHTRRARR